MYPFGHGTYFSAVVVLASLCKLFFRKASLLAWTCRSWAILNLPRRRETSCVFPCKSGNTTSGFTDEEQNFEAEMVEPFKPRWPQPLQPTTQDSSSGISSTSTGNGRGISISRAAAAGTFEAPLIPTPSPPRQHTFPLLVRAVCAVWTRSPLAVLVTPVDAAEEEEEEEEEEDGRAARFWWREQAVAKRSRSVLKAADCVTYRWCRAGGGQGG